MSLLLNEDFTLYRLRLGYLNTIHDGVGERLIQLNTSVLNEPAFRAAGWAADAAALKRCYSPPIPTTGAADYFARPSRFAVGRDDDEDERAGGGLISGHRGSEDLIGPSVLTEKERRRRKAAAASTGENPAEEEDSSDLSDDTDEDDGVGAAVGSVRFAKMPMRKRSNTSPPVQQDKRADGGGPEVTVTSPSYRPRTSSLGATEAIHAANAQAAHMSRTGRPRRDTTTSSEMSSENEGLGPETSFRKKLPSRPKKSALLAEKIAEEEPEDEESELEGEEEEEEEEDVEVAEASDLSDELEGEGEEEELAQVTPELPIEDMEEAPKPALRIPPAVHPTSSTHATKKSAGEDLVKLPQLPPGRPISVAPPSSLLSMALQGAGGAGAASKPYQKYAELYGKGEVHPLWIKIYAPFSETADKAIAVPLRRVKDAEGGVPTVEELIGLALWRYDEEGFRPALTGRDAQVENWELRMVEDGEVDMDFPALSRTRAVTDFTSNNNRPPQRRMRDRPWDEFGLVRAENATSEEEVDGADAGKAAAGQARTEKSIAPPTPRPDTPAAPSMIPNRNPITGPSFALGAVTRKDSSNLLDVPQAPAATSTPRMGAAVTVTVHFTDPQSFQTQRIALPTTADTYIAELFDVACARLRLDKALYVLKVRGTQTVAPPDRTVEALGANLHLDLVRRRFGAVGDFGLGLSASPGSTSPNAPLELVPNTPPTAKEAKRRKGIRHPLAGGIVSSTSTSLLDLTAFQQVGKRYNVLRKQPLSFAASHPRTLVVTPEMMQILPAGPDHPALAHTNTGSGGGPGGPSRGHKVTNIPMSSIVGVKVSRKHPKMMRVLVYREKETKRYDFECASHAEAESIVGDVRVGLAEYGGGADGGGT
ncbi:hypothetical protein M433DRAFT_152194 [Acidomyces richmondensis BFW]|nr:MAG: hypothetical protein FE78DRAFT_86921 [Acidomyces sp. 'richmondensis']KYG47499.1 hypothetical protein M433DRAFT_152194 [Acidomyces richmondensis BFW]